MLPRANKKAGHANGALQLRVAVCVDSGAGQTAPGS